MCKIHLLSAVFYAGLAALVSCTPGDLHTAGSGIVPNGVSGDYLGQAAPEDTASIFAEGIVSTGLASRDIAITPDGNEIYFGVTVGDYTSTIAVCKRIGGKWTGPEIADFCTDPGVIYFEPCITHDGNRLYFLSTLPDGKEPPGDQDIWYVERMDQGWGQPINTGPPVNSKNGEFFPSLTRKGDMYFTRAEEGSQLNRIYR